MFTTEKNRQGCARNGNLQHLEILQRKNKARGLFSPSVYWPVVATPYITSARIVSRGCKYSDSLLSLLMLGNYTELDARFVDSVRAAVNAYDHRLKFGSIGIG
jgi:hypothetical protein